MQTELVQATTNDGIPLDGAFFAAEGLPSQKRALDAVLLVHGSGGNFYSKLLLAVAQGLRQAAYPSVSFNTTGHDLVWGAPEKLMGNAHEILDRCRLDIKAGIDWLEGRGYKRIGIFGHSMGAVKVVYYQATERDQRVAAVISSSPVRLSHSSFLTTEGADEHRRNIDRAQSLINEGRPDDVFPVSFPMPHLFSARSYLDKHGPDERYNLVKYVKDVRCPLLIMAGSLEDHPRLRNCAVDMHELVKDRAEASLVIQQGADHGYTGMLDRLADKVVSWVARLETVEAQVSATD